MPGKISAIVFDIGNVLLSFDYKIIIEKFEQVEKGLGQKFISLYKENYHLHRAHEKAELESDKFVEIMLGWIDYKLPREEFLNIYADVFVENAELVSLLPALKKKYKLVVLSNTNPIHQKQFMKQFSFWKYFDKLVLSHEVRSFKPESEIYSAVENFTKVNPEEHFYIDDIDEYIKAAKSRGWQGVVMQNNEQVFSDFRKLGII